MATKKDIRRTKIKFRIRHKVSGTAEMPRLSVFRSNKEIYAQDDSVTGETGDSENEEIFGYQEAWAEYRYKPSHVTGEMRSSYSQSLDVWHLADDYSGLPGNRTLPHSQDHQFHQ